MPSFRPKTTSTTYVCQTSRAGTGSGRSSDPAGGLTVVVAAVVAVVAFADVPTVAVVAAVVVVAAGAVGCCALRVLVDDAAVRSPRSTNRPSAVPAAKRNNSKAPSTNVRRRLE